MSHLYFDTSHSVPKRSEQERALERQLQASAQKADAALVDGYQRLLTAATSFKSLLPNTQGPNTQLSKTPHSSSAAATEKMADPNEQCHLAMSSLVQSLVNKNEKQRSTQGKPVGGQQQVAGVVSGPENKSDAKSSEQSSLSGSLQEDWVSEDSKQASGSAHHDFLSFEQGILPDSDPSSAIVGTDRGATSQSVDNNAVGESVDAASTTDLSKQNRDTKKHKDSSSQALGKLEVVPLATAVDPKAELSSDAIKVTGKEALGELALRAAAVQAQATTEATTAVQRLMAQLNSYFSQPLSQAMHQVRISLPNQLSATSAGEVVLQIQGRDVKIDIRGASDEAKSLILPRLNELQVRPGLKDFQLQVSWSSMGSTASLMETTQAKTMAHGWTSTDQASDDRKHKTPYDEEESDDD